MKFGERIEAAMKHLGWGPTDLAKASGVAMATISALVRRASDRSDYKEALVQGFPASKISHEWLRSEVGEMEVAEPTQEPPRPIGAPARTPTMQPILAWEHPDDLPEGEFVLIPRLGIHLSAGNGYEQVEIEFLDKQPQAFRADWIRKKHLKPKKLASMIADGDSMEDRIQHGDALVVDTSQKDVVDGKVYALWYDGGERVKRLYRLPGGILRIQSDNTKYPEIEVQPSEMEHVRIIGRIVYVAGEGGL